MRFFIEKCLDEKWSDDLSLFYLKSISDDAKPHLSKIEKWIKQKDIQKNKGLVLLSYLSVINDIKGQAKKNLSEICMGRFRFEFQNNFYLLLSTS